MKFAPVLVLALQAAGAQPATTVETAASAREALVPRVGERKLRCQVEPISPILLYSVPEIAVGYTFSMPLSQYGASRPEHGWDFVTGFTPVGREDQTTYTGGRVSLPTSNADTAQGRRTYWIGIGTYHVRWAMFDEKGGVCRQEWSIQVGGWPPPPPVPGPFVEPTALPSVETIRARLTPQEVDPRTRSLLAVSKISLGTPEGTVRTPTYEGSPAPDGARRITLLVHAPSDRSAQLAVSDAVEAIRRQLPAKVVRLVAFSLEQGKEILRQDGFDAGALEAAFATLDYRAVTVGELQSQPMLSPAELLNSLVRREIGESASADAVLFVGISSLVRPDSGPFAIASVKRAPPLYYVQFLTSLPETASLPPGHSAGDPNNPVDLVGMQGRTPPTSASQSNAIRMPSGKDCIALAMEKLKGKTLEVFDFGQFDQAMEKVRRSPSGGKR
jgi:hypothetical protein